MILIVVSIPEDLPRSMHMNSSVETSVEKTCRSRNCSKIIKHGRSNYIVVSIGKCPQIVEAVQNQVVESLRNDMS